MKFLVLLLLVSFAHAVEITEGQMYVFENEYVAYTYNAFRGPGVSLNYVIGDVFFDSGIGWHSRCWGGCSLEDLKGGGLIDFVDPAFAVINGVPTELSSYSVGFQTTSFKSSFTPDGLNVSGFASGSGWFEPCSLTGECTGEATRYTFNPERRWRYNASFHVYPDLPQDYPYYIREMTVTAVPEMGSLALTLMGMVGLGGFRFLWR